MGVGEGRDEARQEQSEDDKDDSEDDHDVYLVSALMFGRIAGVSAEGIHFAWPSGDLSVPWPVSVSFGAPSCTPGIIGTVVSRSVAGQVVDKPTGTGGVNAELEVIRVPG